MLDELKKQIADAPLTEDEKGLVSSIVENLDDDTQRELQGLFTESPWFIPYIYVNSAAKKYALAKADVDAFRSVVANEADVLEMIE